MSSEPSPDGAVRHTTKLFAPLLALLFGVAVAASVAWYLAAPRWALISLLTVLGFCLTAGPYIWIAIRYHALSGYTPLLWTADGDPDEVHLSKFSPEAWRRSVWEKPPVEKQSYSGPVYVGRDLRREVVDIPDSVDEVTRWKGRGTWRGSLDWWEFEVVKSSLVSTWQDLVPKVQKAADAEGRAANQTLENSIDVAAGLMTGVERDTVWSGENVDLGSAFDLDGDADDPLDVLGESASDEEGRASQQDIDEAVAADVTTNGGAPDVDE